MPAKFNGVVTLVVAVKVPEFSAGDAHEAEWMLRGKACEIASQASTIHTVYGTIIGADTEYVSVSEVKAQPEVTDDPAAEVSA